MDKAAPATDTPEVRAQLEVFQRGVVDLIERRELAERIARSLAAKKPLRIKFGMDPSSPDLHVGHCVPLFKLRDLQQLGHKIVLIVGDSTAMVGDPSGRNKLRPQLTRAEVETNLATYVEQVAKVLDLGKTEVRRNSEWFDAMRFEDVLRLTGKMTVARMLERDTFQKRVQENEPIGIHEFLYPLMQGWDSVMIQCDLELGGTDQLFNLLRGRDLQAGEGQPGQVCFTLPLINGLDGRKMSKSYGNAIALNDSPKEMFGKVMSIPDEVLGDWFTLLTRLPQAEIDKLLAGGFRDAKARLGEEIAASFHGRAAGVAAREAFDRQFRDKEKPTDLQTVCISPDAVSGGLLVANALRDLGLYPSTSDSRRAIMGGGVSVNGVKVASPTAALRAADFPADIRAGRRWVRLVLGT